MAYSSYNEWLSLYDDEIGKIYNQEGKAELKKLSMIFTAFQKELTKIKEYLGNEYDDIKTKIEQKNSGKLSKLEIVTPLNEKCGVLNEIPETELFSLKSPPINNTNRLSNLRKRIPTTTSPSISIMNPKPESRLLYRKDDDNNGKTTPICDTTNLIDCSIVESTPITTKKSSTIIKNSRLKCRRNKRRPLQNTTLTQMFGSPTKKNNNNQTADSNFVSMNIDEMLDYINKNEDSIANKENNFVEDSCDSDETIEIDDDDVGGVVETKIPDKNLLKFVDNYDRLPERKAVGLNEVVRGKERKKLKGWSCRDCENFYKNLNLSPDELAKKMDECSRHRRQFQREETAPGFWDLSFPSTQKKTEEETDDESLVFRYKR